MRHLLVVFLFCAVQDRDAVKKEFQEKKEALAGSKDADAWSKVGDWARENGLKEDAKSCYKRAEGYQSEHAGAVAGMKILGYVLEEGVWRTAREVYDRKRRSIPRENLDERHALAEWARDYGLEKEWRKELEDSLKLNPYHRPSRLSLGFQFAYGEWWTEEELAVEKRIDEAFDAALKAGKSPAEVFADARPAGYGGTLKEVERICKLAESPRGTHKDVKFVTDKFSGEYTYGVPNSYVPWRKNTLVFFLHGGGDGAGDGDEYFPQIWPHAAPRGHITVCPTVLEKVSLAWNNPRHVEYIRALVDEVRSKYNVDDQRMYLMGHSMGGFGCFFIGTHTTDLFAAISPWSGGPGGAVLSNLKHTPTYIIHGRDDSRVGVEGSRQAAKQLQQMKAPVVYVEINGFDHAVPPDEQRKALDWLQQWRFNPLARKK